MKWLFLLIALPPYPWEPRPALPPMPSMILSVSNVPPIAHITINDFPKSCPPQPDGYPPWIGAVALPGLTNAVPYFSQVRTTSFGDKYLHFEYLVETGKVYELQYTVTLPPTNYVYTQPFAETNWPTTNWVAWTRLGPFTNSFTLNTDHALYTCDNRFFRVRSD